MTEFFKLKLSLLKDQISIFNQKFMKGIF